MIIDTDIGLGTPNAGIDDGLALTYAFGKSKESHVELITTVFGNVVGNQAYKNAASLLEALGVEGTRVEKGALKPLKGMQQTEPSAEVAGKLIIESVEEHPGQTTLVCIGPLTNIATAILLEPDFPSQVEEAYVMGGAIEEPGNVTPASEFNIYSDPIAAKIVFNSKMPMTLVPLDVTTKTLIRSRHLDTLKLAGGKALDYICRWIEPWLKFQEQILKLGGGNLHDPLTVAIAIDNTLAKMEQMYVDVETKGEITKGMTVAERRRFATPRANMRVCRSIDEPKFMVDFMDTLRLYAER
ncbi:MAG: nucleoside hydrolase [Promethearchaeati archaeon SRVP18_Atabeyarchaeia-1]